MGERSNAYTLFTGKSEGNIPLGKRAANMRIIIKWIITKRIGLCGLDSWHRFICFCVWTSSGLLSGPVAGSCQYCDRFPAGSGDFSVLQSSESGCDAQYPHSALLEAPSLALKLSGRGANHLLPSKVEVKNEWRFTPIHTHKPSWCA